MKKLSSAKLAKIVSTKREEMGLTQEELSKLTGINRVMIGRIEREDYIPSISQFELLGKILHFELTEMFTKEEEPNEFIALRNEALNECEKEGVEKLFSMMLTLRQHILLRKKFEDD